MRAHRLSKAVFKAKQKWDGLRFPFQRCDSSEVMVGLSGGKGSEAQARTPPRPGPWPIWTSGKQQRPPLFPGKCPDELTSRSS